MRQTICRFIYHQLLGWKKVVTIPLYDKCVICAAPHTSNNDLFIGKLFYGTMGQETNFMMKKEWFFFPIGLFFKTIGGIPVDRKNRTTLIEQMVNHFSKSKKFHLAITPEGTRKANPKWKRGFYYIALKACVPIVLVGIDYKSKTIISNQVITPSGNVEEDIREIKHYFKHFKGKHPENFSVGDA